MLKEMYTAISGENYLSLRKSENNYMEMTFIFSGIICLTKQKNRRIMEEKMTFIFIKTTNNLGGN